MGDAGSEAGSGIGGIMKYRVMVLLAGMFLPGLGVAGIWRDAVIGNVGVVRPYLPNIYAMGTVTEGKLTYGGGLEWALDNWWGLGFEYRQAQMRYMRRRKRGTAHAVGVRAYGESPSIGRLCLRAEVGGAAIIGQASDIRVDTGWAVGARTGVRWRLTDRVSALGWAGLIRTGRVDTDIGYYPSAWMPDYGLGIWVGL